MLVRQRDGEDLSAISPSKCHAFTIKMKFTIDSKQTFDNPLPAVVAAGLKTLRHDQVALLENGFAWVNCLADSENSLEFQFQFRDGDTFEIFEPALEARLNLSELTEIFLGFLKSDSSWKAKHEWKLTDVQLSPEDILEEARVASGGAPMDYELRAMHSCLRDARNKGDAAMTRLFEERIAQYQLNRDHPAQKPILDVVQNEPKPMPSPSLVSSTNQEYTATASHSSSYLPSGSDIRAYGTVNPKLVCPHCTATGMVHAKQISRRAGVSGGKATGALLTAGVSLFLTGLSRKVEVTSAFCGNCKSSWDF